MSFGDDIHEPELVPPPASFVEVAPMVDGDSDALAAPEPEVPTLVDPAPELDLVLLAAVERHAQAARRFAAGGQHRVAMLHAREALERLIQAIGMAEQRRLLERLVDDVEPRLSGDRDAREAVSP